MNTPNTPTVRHLEQTDHDAWLPLWHGYQAFYQAQIAPETTAYTWQRFHDPVVPMWALGAFVADDLVGICHYLLHESCWTTAPYCYLQDLFVAPDVRGGGVGRALITAVYAQAQVRGASRVYWLTHETNVDAMVLYDKVATRSGFIQYRKILG